MRKNINKLANENSGFYIQNILAGPLIICDPPHIKDGLYLDPIQPGEAIDLTYYDTNMLAGSKALNNALSNGFAIVLDAEEYDRQIYLAEQKEIEQNQEINRKIVEAEAADTIFEAEQINLLSAGNPHGNYAAEALLAQRDSINNPKVWAAEYQKAREQGLVRDPIEFKDLVESGRINPQMSKRGRRIAGSEADNFNEVNQINMTATKATIAMPGSQKMTNNTEDQEEIGEIHAQKRNLSNFNSTGSLTGSQMNIIDSPSPTYSTHPNMRKTASENAVSEDFSEDFIENIDIDQDEKEYDINLKTQNNQVSKRLVAHSPYIGRKPR